MFVQGKLFQGGRT